MIDYTFNKESLLENVFILYCLINLIFFVKNRQINAELQKPELVISTPPALFLRKQLHTPHKTRQNIQPHRKNESQKN